MSDLSDLQQRLEMVADHVVYPAEPDLASSVRAAIASERARPTATRRPWFRTRLAPALAALLLAAVALVALPTTRNAIADWIGLNGLRIGFGGPPQEPLGTDLRLGRETTLEEAVAQAGFVIEPPALLGDPDEVYLMGDRATYRISLVYEEGPDLPRAPSTRVGALLGAFQAQLGDEEIFKKVIATGTAVERIDVNGAPGYWIAGEPHALFYIDERGHFTEDLARLAGNTLAWERDGVVYRLESALGKQRSLEIARSIP